MATKTEIQKLAVECADEIWRHIDQTTVHGPWDPLPGDYDALADLVGAEFWASCEDAHTFENAYRKRLADLIEAR
jgi:hypothetical protein